MLSGAGAGTAGIRAVMLTICLVPVIAFSQTTTTAESGEFSITSVKHAAANQVLPTAVAPEGLEETHILPRTVPSAESIHPAPGLHRFRSNVDLVLVNVTVLDHSYRAVSGLHADSFSVFDGNVKQTIKYLSNEDSPISLTVVLDASGSMAAKMKKTREAVLELFRHSNPQDEWRLIVFGDRPQMNRDFPNSLEEIQEVLNTVQPEGQTALWDALYLGITGLRDARYQRKAIVLISDGGDNHSRYTQGDIKALLEEANVELYAIGLFDSSDTRLEERRGPLVLDEISAPTGGRVLTAHDRAGLMKAVEQISLELRNQYVLGYSPSNMLRDGKWRALKVKVTPPEGQSRFNLFCKNGYYGPAE